MSLLFFSTSSSLTLFPHINQSKPPIFLPQRLPLSLPLPPSSIPHPQTLSLNSTTKNSSSTNLPQDSDDWVDMSLWDDDEWEQIVGGEEEEEESTVVFGGDSKEEEEDDGSPWEGAIVYKRNPSVTHVEYCTTLERLGLGELSTEVSKSRAALMGLRVTRAVKDYPLGTPVHVSVDVTRKKGRLRLDGILKTVLTLDCYSCMEPTAESVYSNFSLLLTEEPVEEPEDFDIDKIFVKNTSSRANSQRNEDDEDASIFWDDRLYFPPNEKEVDISKNIRDLLHLEDTLDVMCDPNCKGACLKCGTNWNTGSCNCAEETEKQKGYGPLKKAFERQMKSKR
ncbi:hypothetical protein Tsubulata_014094 [Turnera subulata]|uniref:DUF177 domain-containing protein n=1 Tax=Turnera subulata TaxID=218843 RepID=A0A9Q0JL64_9ROSI|nr:hypothetical protein Tsubulata_014094 [Turnera subulata]